MLVQKTNEDRPEEVVLELDDPAPKKQAIFPHSADERNGESLCHQE